MLMLRDRSRGVTPRKSPRAAMGHGTWGIEADGVVRGGSGRRGGDDAGPGGRRRPGLRAGEAATGRRGERVPRALPPPPGAAEDRDRGRGSSAVPGTRLAVRLRGALRGHPLVGLHRLPAAARRPGDAVGGGGTARLGVAGTGPDGGTVPATARPRAPAPASP